jgi:predicted AlkP superfamily phosphohydrolase/phosphomutase
VASTRRVVLLALDGLGPEDLEASAASGAAPALAQLLRRGAFGPLATIRPTEGPAVWATLFTGRYPRDHGIKSFSAYRVTGSSQRFDLLPKGTLVPWLERGGFATRVPLAADARHGPALWNALNALGLRTGVVRFWGTHPPERLKGFMLSHSFHQLLREQPERARGALYPPDLAEQVQARAVDPRRDLAALLEGFVDHQAPLPPGGAERERDLAERALAPDLTYERAGLLLRSAYDPPFFALSLYGFDVLGHSFRRYAHPEEFGNVPQAELRRWGKLSERYTTHVDGLVGRLASGLRPGEVLLVVSGYGMRPVPPWRRGLAAVTGGSVPDGLHDDAPDGFILAVGDGVRPGGRFTRASVLDVAPTVLYLMGLPVARDMEGRVMTEALQADFVLRRPLTYIPSYESLAVMELAEPGELPLLPEPEP